MVKNLMSKKYNFSEQVGTYNFQVEGCDSFDEAIKIVKKGVRDWELTRPKPTVLTPPVTPNENIQPVVVRNINTGESIPVNTGLGNKNPNPPTTPPINK
jgi:hypothetical protein